MAPIIVLNATNQNSIKRASANFGIVASSSRFGGCRLISIFDLQDSQTNKEPFADRLDQNEKRPSFVVWACWCGVGGVSSLAFRPGCFLLSFVPARADRCSPPPGECPLFGRFSLPAAD
jgi:hypothetical protein